MATKTETELTGLTINYLSESDDPMSRFSTS